MMPLFPTAALLLFATFVESASAKLRLRRKREHGLTWGQTLPEWRQYGCDDPGTNPMAGCKCAYIKDKVEPPSAAEREEEKLMALASIAETSSFALASSVTCSGGTAGEGSSCSNVNLKSRVDITTLNVVGRTRNIQELSDIWGWTDPGTGREFALAGEYCGTIVVEITDPVNPVVLGKLNTHSGCSYWFDIKVYKDHAFIVSEANRHGMQILDLSQLLTVTQPTEFVETAHYSDFDDAHNVAINEETGFAYAVGTGTCSGGLHVVNISNPTAPTFAGCFSADGYTHDVQCVVYKGPDATYFGKEICFAANENSITIIDVDNKNSMSEISWTGYSGGSYTHQGWLTEDHKYFLFGDESTNQPMRIMDVTDLANPSNPKEFPRTWSGIINAVPHNAYIVGDLVYQAAYCAGLRILRIKDLSHPSSIEMLEEVGHFNTQPSECSSSRWYGPWSVYPFFPSGTIVMADVGAGLLVLEPTIMTPCSAPADCDDTNACTVDSCVSGSCANDPITCNDGVGCTVDSCNESTGCNHIPNDANCPWCEGRQTCDVLSGCTQTVTPPPDCPNGCDEENDTCLPPAPICGDGNIDEGEECEGTNFGGGESCPQGCTGGLIAILTQLVALDVLFATMMAHAT